MGVRRTTLALLMAGLSCSWPTPRREPMAEVVLDSVNKQYDNGFHAVQDLDLTSRTASSWSWSARPGAGSRPP